LNNHSDYGSKLLYNVNPSWIFRITGDVKLKPFVSVSTAFITPTLYQLHTPWGGNIDLQPEESFNTEYGISFFAFDKLNFTVVNFFRKEKDLIGYTFQYENISDKRHVKGVTLDVQYSPTQIVTLSGNFSWVTSDDKQSFYRIPGQKAGLGLQIKPTKTMEVSFKYHYTGERTDLYYDEFFTAHDIDLSSYNVLDISLTQKLINNHLFLYGSVYNVTDENFVGVYGYTTRGRNFSMGARYNF
jgi:vitamin B12 transporter